MKKYNTLFELLKFPLKLILFGYIMLGISTFLLGDNFSILYTITNPLLLTFLDLLGKSGSFIILNAPLIILIKLVSRKTNSYVPIYSAIVGYGVYLVVTAIFSNNFLPVNAYAEIFNVQFTTVDSNNVVRNLYPIQTGFIAAIIVGLSTRQTYKQSRKSHITLLNFLDNDILAITLNAISCFILGIIITFIWPTIYNWFEYLIALISKDISNPLNLFLYGVIEKILTVLGMSDLIREPFWYGINGGTWLAVSGESISGDVSIFSSMINSGFETSTFGKFITPHYIINMFVYPAIFFAFCTLYTNNTKKLTLVPTVVVASILSVLTGCFVPLEMMLLLLCPLLFIVHVFLSASLFAILQFLTIHLGFVYSGDTILALPGTLFDFAIHFRNPVIYDSLIKIIGIGLVFFVIYYFLTIFYYRYLAIDIFQTGELKKILTNFEDSIDGFNNIKSVEATPFKLIIEVHDTTNIKREQLFSIGTDRITESKNHFTFMLGKKSYMIYLHLKYIIKNNND